MLGLYGHLLFDQALSSGGGNADMLRTSMFTICPDRITFTSARYSNDGHVPQQQIQILTTTDDVKY
eukprot:1312161-Amphidinium_carterae.1